MWLPYAWGLRVIMFFAFYPLTIHRSTAFRTALCFAVLISMKRNRAHNTNSCNAIFLTLSTSSGFAPSRTIFSVFAIACRFVTLVTVITLQSYRSALCIIYYRLCRVPLLTRIRLMPVFRQFQPFSLVFTPCRYLRFGFTLPHMYTSMFLCGKTLQIIQRIIQRVPVYVMYLIAFGYLTICRLPYLTVQRSNTLFSILCAAYVVLLCGDVVRVRVSTKRNSVENNDFRGIRHSVHPYALIRDVVGKRVDETRLSVATLADNISIPQVHPYGA